MNKILNTSIENNKLILSIQSDLKIENISQFNVYVDEFYNWPNIYSADTHLHSYTLTGLNSTFTIDASVDNSPTLAPYMYTVTITSDIVNQFDRTLKYVKLFNTEQALSNWFFDSLFIDKNILYYAEINRIALFSNYKVLDSLMQLIMLSTFKMQMLEMALNADDKVNAMRTYSDIIELLNVSINKDVIANNV